MSPRSATSSTRSARVSRQVKVALRKIATFEKRFGASHLPLLYQAAFPLALTPDLLYRLWANFQRDIHGHFLNVPWVAVADILLSSLCEDVGQELYEMDDAVRNELLQRLQADENFGQRRIQELSDFLLEYVRNQLQSSDVDVRDFAQAQKWTVLAYTKPGRAVYELANTFQQLGIGSSQPGEQNKCELIRMAALVETFANPLADAELQPLLTYAKGISSWAKGDDQQASKQLEQVADAGKIQIAGVDLPIPKDIHTHSAAFDTPGNADYSGQNLRGRSFVGQDLNGADFSNADIRGANFSEATLTNANFRCATTGLQRRWASVLVLLSLLLVFLAGALATMVGTAGWFGLFLLFDNLPLDTEQTMFSLTGATGFAIFVVMCVTTLLRTQTPAWNSGALGLISSALFAAAIFSPIVALTQWIYRGGFAWGFAWLLMALAVASAIVLLRIMQGRWFIASVLSLAFGVISILVSLGATPAVFTAIALSVIAVAFLLFLLWMANKTTKFFETLMLMGVVTLVAAVVAGGIFQIVNSDWLGAVVLVLGVVVIAVVVMTPMVVTGADLVSGSVFGMLITITAISVFFLLFWVNSYNEAAALTILLADTALATAAIAWATIIITAIAVNLLWADTENKAIALLWTLLGTFPLIVIAVLLTPAVIPFLSALNLQYNQFLIATAASVALASSIPLLGIFIGWRALNGDPKYASIKSFATAFSAKGGTSFREADLTNADFTEATLKSADFTAANLTRTCWFHVQKLDHACVGNSYLQHPKIQQLVTTGIGNNQNFDRLNMAGIRLQNINLADSSFTDTNLFDADLSNTNLSRARLVNTQLDEADLSGACLTGAYIPNWFVNNRTKLQGIDCQYIFTKVPTKDDPDPKRYPADHRKILKPGELASILTKSSSRPQAKVGKTAAAKTPQTKVGKNKRNRS
ncbi:MAG: pentapeptide repeat-containing protein [Cyanobacteria bacterium J06581_3]